MTGQLLEVVAVGCAALGGALLPTHQVRVAAPPPRSRGRAGDAAEGPWRRWRAWWCLGAFLAGALWVSGAAGVGVGAALAAVAWVAIGRAEPAGVRREREAARAELPHVVFLLAATLRSGTSAEAGLGMVAQALPGVAADRLAGLRARLALGADPATAWASLAADPVLAPLGRALARTHETGAPVAETVERLARDLAGRRRADAEDRARTVGVRAAVPLGLCLLPSFMLLGIVPIVAGLLDTVLT